MTNQDIRERLALKHSLKEYAPNGTVEIRGASFLVTDDHLFGKPNPAYIAAELQWYEEQSLSVDRLAEIYGKRVAIWDQVADSNGFINSNYGFLIYSTVRSEYSQYNQCLWALQEDPNSRRGVMVYTRPTAYIDATRWDGNDMICTNVVHYHIIDGMLHAVVQMRSNDAIYGFNNDIAWQQHVLNKLAGDLNVEPGTILWQAASLHVYPRHFHLLEEFTHENY